MKKVMWMISMISLVGTAVFLQWMPERVPMHYDADGNIDRWGSKNEMLIFPLIILLLSLFWTLMIRYFEKKAKNAVDEKETAGALSNVKVLSVVGISMAVMYTVLQGYLLYGAYQTAGSGTTKSAINIEKISFILMGILLMVVGNVMPKTRTNGALGVRISWSMYNDYTWTKTNRFGGYMLMIAGILMVVEAIVISNSHVVTMVSMALIVLACAITVVYAHRVYLDEKEAEKKD